MALETADFIDQLDENNPAINDPVGRGDDHVRLVKHVLKTTFPNFSGAVALTDAEIDALPTDITDAVDAAVASLSPHIVPTGAITLWAGSIASIPTGWQLCNGTNGTPDLRDRFVVGAGASYAVGNNGGSNTKTTSSTAVSFTSRTGGTAITIAQMPAHNHNSESYWSTIKNEASTIGPDYDPSDNDGRVASVQTQGGGQPHDHSIPNSNTHSHTVDVRPLYYALAYIQKMSTFT